MHSDDRFSLKIDIRDFTAADKAASFSSLHKQHAFCLMKKKPFPGRNLKMQTHYGCSKKAIFHTQLNGIMVCSIVKQPEFFLFFQTVPLSNETGLNTSPLTRSETGLKMSAEYTKSTFTLM